MEIIPHLRRVFAPARVKVDQVLNLVPEQWPTDRGLCAIRVSRWTWRYVRTSDGGEVTNLGEVTR
jgi:hypothetical protein